MKKIFITGVSGTGKSAVAHILNSKGIFAISIDETPGLCSWKNKVTGEVVNFEAELNKEFIEKYDWICDEEILYKLINTNQQTVVVVGIASNQNNFLNSFDKILLLQCKPETFIQRMINRKDNNFGKDKSAQEHILSFYKKFENDLLDRGAISINSENPIDEVVDNIIKEVK